MKIKTLVVGQLQTNCYLLIKDNACLIIDPGDEFTKIKDQIGSFNVLGILITHHHFDHVGALKPLQKLYNVKVYEYSNLKEQEYEIGPFKFEVIYTLGHSNDSVTYYFKKEKIMFVGDFIFASSIGRTDLDTGDSNLMVKSLIKIKSYNDDIKLFPGHGNSTTLGYEKEHNYYLENI